jgi:peptidoglycan hydrolase CwlO-like protein
MSIWVIILIVVMTEILIFIFSLRHDLQDVSRVEEAINRIKIVETRQNTIQVHLKNLLNSIKQNAENIDQLDDDIYRLENRIDNLIAKKAGE